MRTGRQRITAAAADRAVAAIERILEAPDADAYLNGIYRQTLERAKGILHGIYMTAEYGRKEG